MDNCHNDNQTQFDIHEWKCILLIDLVFLKFEYLIVLCTDPCHLILNEFHFLLNIYL